MLPAVRAIADRMILDSANLKYIAAILPRGGLGRIVPGTGWTVRQVIGHVGDAEARHVAAMERLLAGATPFPADYDRDDANAASAQRDAKAPLKSLVARIDDAVSRSVPLYECVTASIAASRARGKDTLAVLLDRWSRHYVAHGIDLVDALPEIRFDPMLLNWLLFVDFEGEPDAAARQRKLWEDVRALPDEDDDEDLPDPEEDQDAF